MSLLVSKHGTLEPSMGDRKRGIDLSLLIVSCLSLLKVSSWGFNFPSVPGSHLPAASGEATYVLKQDASPSTMFSSTGRIYSFWDLAWQQRLQIQWVWWKLCLWWVFLTLRDPRQGWWWDKQLEVKAHHWAKYGHSYRHTCFLVHIVLSLLYVLNLSFN